MKKKVLSVLLSGMMVLGLLAGCGESAGTADTTATPSGSSQTASSDTANGEKTKLTALFCVYPFVQKYFENGVMIGAVKG